MPPTESFDRWMKRETAALDLLDDLLDRVRADLEWLEALDERERAQEVVGYES